MSILFTASDRTSGRRLHPGAEVRRNWCIGLAVAEAVLGVAAVRIGLRSAHRICPGVCGVLRSAGRSRYMRLAAEVPAFAGQPAAAEQQGVPQVVEAGVSSGGLAGAALAGGKDKQDALGALDDGVSSAG